VAVVVVALATTPTLQAAVVVAQAAVASGINSRRLI
jgi:hypothetical protein